jgi:hypothetical protein
VQCSAVQCSAVQCSAVQCSAVQCSAVQCSIVQCSTLHCTAVQCSEVQCGGVPSRDSRRTATALAIQAAGCCPAGDGPGATAGVTSFCPSLLLNTFNSEVSNYIYLVCPCI